MRKHAMARLLAAGICLLSAGASRAAAPDEPRPSPVLDRLHAQLLPIFQRYYPRVTSRLDGTVMAFEQDTRTFLIHASLMAGGWQEARETKGPNPTGILCSIKLEAGRWEGQALLPQTVDDRYFKTYIAAVASGDQREYLMVSLSYPDTVEPGFLAAFHEAMAHAWPDAGAAKSAPVHD